jgi:glucokinase
MPTILAADIGATNSRFALFTANLDGASPQISLQREQWLEGASYPSFSDVLDALKRPGNDGAPFIDVASAPDIAVLAPAGPVHDNECHLSNLPWVVRASDVEQALGIPRALLINDFVAQAYACMAPQNIDAVPLLPGKAMPGTPIAVVGAGTGFGKALVLPAEDADSTAAGFPESKALTLRYLTSARVLPSEGGHTEFPFVGEEEFAFAAFAVKDIHVRRLLVDHIVSGKGLATLYAFHTGQSLSPPEATARAIHHPQTLATFARFYARVCRNFALNTLSLGGLFVTGGMALRLPVLQHAEFAREFRETSPEQGALLRNIPIWHVRSHQAGLWGAAVYGVAKFDSGQQGRTNV